MCGCFNVKDKKQEKKQKQKKPPKILLQLRFGYFYFNSHVYKEEQKETATVCDGVSWLYHLFNKALSPAANWRLPVDSLNNFLGCPLTLMHIHKWSISKCK